MKYYAGIGSRKTPVSFKNQMIKIAEMLREKQYVLRSGGADGADQYFEAGAGNLKEIYLPWKRFNGSDSIYYDITENAYRMAEIYHPNWGKLSEGARNLMARNCYQVLGLDLNTPVEFIVCWTPNGGVEGGTGQALRIAKDYKIPIFNLHKQNAMVELNTHINKVRLI